MCMVEEGVDELLDTQDASEVCRLLEEWLTKRSSKQGADRLDAERMWKTTLSTCWVIWKKLCNMVFQNIQPELRRVILVVKKLLDELQILTHTR